MRLENCYPFSNYFLDDYPIYHSHKQPGSSPCFLLFSIFSVIAHISSGLPPLFYVWVFPIPSETHIWPLAAFCSPHVPWGTFVQCNLPLCCPNCKSCQSGGQQYPQHRFYESTRGGSNGTGWGGSRREKIQEPKARVALVLIGTDKCPGTLKHLVPFMKNTVRLWPHDARTPGPILMLFGRNIVGL